MKRRICLVGAALSVVAMTFGGSAAGAATHKPARAKTINLKCLTNVGVMIAQGDTAVAPPAASGTEYGSVACGKGLGGGIQKDAFQIPDSGDTLASYQMYFPTGTIHGKYDLTPQEGTFGGSGFSGVNYVGTLTITGGTGAFVAARGAGTMACGSADGIHTTCTDRLKLKRL